MENKRKFSFNYHNIPSLSVLLTCHAKPIQTQLLLLLFFNFLLFPNFRRASIYLVVGYRSGANNPKSLEPRHDNTNKMTVRPAKTQISLGIRPVWSESLLCAQGVAKDPSLLHADSEDSDQTGRMPRLIWVFAGPTVILLILSCRGSSYLKDRK